MSKSSELDRKVKLFILDNIDSDNYEVSTTTPAEKMAFLKATFMSEYGWRVTQVGRQEALIDYLQGLPSSVSLPFYYHDIIELAIKWGSLSQAPTDKQADKITDNYWNFMAAKICQLFDGYRVPK